MSSETPATPVEPAPEAATTPNPVPEPKQEPDWRAAYVGLQRTVNKLHTREDDLVAQNSVLATSVGGLKEDLDVLLKQSVGEEEFGKRVISRAQQQERAAALQAAQAGQQFIVGMTGMYLETLSEVGVNPNDPSIDWARDAGNVEEWRERVGPSIKAAVQRANEARIHQHEASLAAKTKKEVEVEAQAMTEQQLKAAGVDRIDTAKGSGRATFAEKVRDPEYRNSPQFLTDLAAAKAGRLKT